MKKYIIAMLLLSITLFLSACEQKNFLIKVNNNIISDQEFALYIYMGKSYYEEIGGEDIWQTPIDGEKAVNVLKNSMIEAVVRTKVQMDIAKTKGIKLTNDEIEQVKEEVDKYMEDEDISKQFSRETVERFQTENMILIKLFEEETKNVIVNDEMFNAYMESLGISSLNVLSQEEISDYKGEYQDNKKKELFDQKYSEWKNNAKIEYNTEELDKIEIQVNN